MYMYLCIHLHIWNVFSARYELSICVHISSYLMRYDNNYIMKLLSAVF